MNKYTELTDEGRDIWALPATEVLLKLRSQLAVLELRMNPDQITSRTTISAMRAASAAPAPKRKASRPAAARAPGKVKPKR